MKTLNTLIITTCITAAGGFTPTVAQHHQTSNAVTGNRSVSAGIGFTDDSAPWQGKIGAAIGPYPEYDGADKYAASAIPFFDIQKPGAFFLRGADINLNNGLASAGLTLLHFSYTKDDVRHLQIVMGPLVRAYGGRDESDSADLTGLGDIDQSVGLGGFLELRAAAWLANLSVTPQDVGNDKDGLLAVLNIDYTTSSSDSMKIFTGLTTSWADDDYMQGYFGVTEAQAARSGLSRYDSHAGFKDVGLQLKTTYALSSSWLFEAQAGYWRLLNDAADSPIVKDKGSAAQIRGLVGITFQF